MFGITMEGKDAITGSMAEVFCTIEGTRYNLLHVISGSANCEKNKVQVPILGRTGRGNKSVGWSGSGSMTCHANNSIMAELALKYAKTGVDTYFELQVTINDPTSATGQQSVVLVDCNFDSVDLFSFDADADYATTDLSFTFEDFEVPESFTLLPGMV